MSFSSYELEELSESDQRRPYHRTHPQVFLGSLRKKMI